MPKRKNKSRIKAHEDLVKRQNEASRVEYHKLIDDRPEKVEEILFEKSKNFKKHNLLVKEKDISQEKNSVQNKSVRQLKAGFINSQNKEKYIQVNRASIRSLPQKDQRTLIKYFLDFI